MRSASCGLNRDSSGDCSKSKSSLLRSRRHRAARRSNLAATSLFALGGGCCWYMASVGIRKRWCAACSLYLLTQLGQRSGAPGPTARLRLGASSVQSFYTSGWPTRRVGRATRLPEHASKTRKCVASLVYCSHQHYQQSPERPLWPRRAAVYKISKRVFFSHFLAAFLHTATDCALIAASSAVFVRAVFSLQSLLRSNRQLARCRISLLLDSIAQQLSCQTERRRSV